MEPPVVADPELPTGKTTLVVLLGASEYPEKPDWTNSALGKSAKAIRDYFLSSQGFDLERAHILDLFESKASQTEQLLKIHTFLETTGPNARDLIIYYIGHGGLLANREYYLSIRSTLPNKEHITALESSKLAKTVRTEFRNKRIYVIIDACFAASALPDWQAKITTATIRNLEQHFPAEGTVFLAASSKYDVANAPKEGPGTIFTTTVVDTLIRGVRKIRRPKLSTYNLYEAVHQILLSRDKQEGDVEGMPELHVPSQHDGDISQLPIFPNAAYTLVEESHQAAVAADAAVAVASEARSKLAERVRALEEARTELKAAEQNAAKARAQASTRDIELAEKQQKLERTKQAVTRAQDKVRDLEQQARKAQARVEATKNAVEKAKAEVDEAERQVTRAREDVQQSDSITDSIRIRASAADSEATRANSETIEREREAERARAYLISVQERLRSADRRAFTTLRSGDLGGAVEVHETQSVHAGANASASTPAPQVELAVSAATLTSTVVDNTPQFIHAESLKQGLDDNISAQKQNEIEVTTQAGTTQAKRSPRFKLVLRVGAFSLIVAAGSLYATTKVMSYRSPSLPVNGSVPSPIDSWSASEPSEPDAVPEQNDVVVLDAGTAPNDAGPDIDAAPDGAILHDASIDKLLIGDWVSFVNGTVLRFSYFPKHADGTCGTFSFKWGDDGDYTCTATLRNCEPSSEGIVAKIHNGRNCKDISVLRINTTQKLYSVTFMDAWDTPQYIRRP